MKRPRSFEPYKTKMKYRKGMAMEHVLNTIIAVFCLLLLLYMGYQLIYKSWSEGNEDQKAEAVLDEFLFNLNREIPGTGKEIVVANPEGWALMYYGKFQQRPSNCEGYENCLCICKTKFEVVVGRTTGGLLDSEVIKSAIEIAEQYKSYPYREAISDCESKGICKETSSKLSIANPGIIYGKWGASGINYYSRLVYYTDWIKLSSLPRSIIISENNWEKAAFIGSGAYSILSSFLEEEVQVGSLSKKVRETIIQDFGNNCKDGGNDVFISDLIKTKAEQYVSQRNLKGAFRIVKTDSLGVVKEVGIEPSSLGKTWNDNLGVIKLCEGDFAVYVIYESYD